MQSTSTPALLLLAARRRPPRDVVVIDTETTGLKAGRDALIEIAAVRFTREGRIIGARDWLVDPGRPIPRFISDYTHITDRLVRGKPSPREAVARLARFAEGADILTHGGAFDLRFLQAEQPGLFADRVLFDTLELARALLPELQHHQLGDLSAHFDLGFDHRRPHRAWSDANATRALFLRLVEYAEQLPAERLQELRAAGPVHSEGYRVFFDEIARGGPAAPRVTTGAAVDERLRTLVARALPHRLTAIRGATPARAPLTL